MRRSYSEDEEYSPLFYLGGRPIYAAYLLIGVFTASMVTAAVLMAAKAGGFLEGLIFLTPQVLAGQVWRFVTYVLVNPPSWDFAAAMLMLFLFGRDLEKYLGRRAFLLLYGHAILVSPLVQTLFAGVQPSLLAGCLAPNVCVFAAFAFIYPTVGLFFGLAARVLLWIYVSIQSLIYLSYGLWGNMFGFLAVIGTTYLFVQTWQGKIEWNRTLARFFSLKWLTGAFQGKPRIRVVAGGGARAKAVGTSAGKVPDLTVVPRSGSETAGSRAAAKSETAEIDRLLDKINRSGIQSLTAEERLRLQKASEDLSKSDK
jgi:membrane associated rhomboid family serine protease